MSTFEQAYRDPCMAIPRERLVITAPEARPAVLGDTQDVLEPILEQSKAASPTSWPTSINPRECDHHYQPLREGLVCCSICGWWWDADFESSVR
jgi:hypothetical protein